MRVCSTSAEIIVLPRACLGKGFMYNAVYCYLLLLFPTCCFPCCAVLYIVVVSHLHLLLSCAVLYIVVVSHLLFPFLVLYYILLLFPTCCFPSCAVLYIVVVSTCCFPSCVALYIVVVLPFPAGQSSLPPQKKIISRKKKKE